MPLNLQFPFTAVKHEIQGWKVYHYYRMGDSRETSNLCLQFLDPPLFPTCVPLPLWHPRTQMRRSIASNKENITTFQIFLMTAHIHCPGV